MLNITDLITPVTIDQQEESFLVTLEGLSLNPRAWRKGGSLRTILRTVAGVYAAFSTLAVQFVKSGFLDLASGGWLTLLAFYTYNVTRVAATFATGTVTLSNSGGGVFNNVAVGGLVVSSSVLKKSYTNTAIFSLSAGPGTSVDVPIQAIELGAASTASIGQIDTLQTAMAGVTVSNAAAVVGRDAEADADLQARCRAKLGTISGLGPRGAYYYAATTAVRGDGSLVDVNRVAISPSSSTGVVTVYCASASGTVTAPDLVYIATSVEAIARPDSVTATVLSATPLPYSPTLTIWAKTTAGLDAAGLKTLVNAALLAMIRTYPIGGLKKPPSTQGYLFATSIEAAAQSAHASIYAVDGASNLAMAVSDVVTLSATVNVQFSS